MENTPDKTTSKPQIESVLNSETQKGRAQIVTDLQRLEQSSVELFADTVKQTLKANEHRATKAESGQFTYEFPVIIELLELALNGWREPKGKMRK